MTDPRNCHEVALRPLVFDSVEAESVTVTTDHVYRGSGGRELHFDVYRPAQPACVRPPVVLLTTGFPDDGMRKAIGCPAKAMQSYRSWARLIAGSGLAAVTYTNHEPVADARAILDHLRDNGEALQIDERRIGLWACSGNVPNALSLLMSDWPVAAAALLYGYMLDLDGGTEVADAARLWRFANPAADKLLDDLPPDRPLLIVRAGRDAMAGLNGSIDRFTARALALNKAFTLVNVPEARHAFDTVDKTASSRHAIACVLAFLRQHVLDAR